MLRAARRTLLRGVTVALMLWGGGAAAQELSGLARVDSAQSAVRDVRQGAELDLWLSQVVPWRVFTLDAPRRLVVDFREIDWRGASRDQLLQSAMISDLRFGQLRPGWSRMVLDLAEPLTVRSAEMQVDDLSGTARLRVALSPTDEADYAARAGAPADPGWDALAELDVTQAPAKPPDDGVLTVAIDAGHGGLDPGAQRGGVNEADLMLALARDLEQAILRAGNMRPVMIRDADVFVPLEKRMTIARAAGAEVFLSLHADALEIGQAAGASFYTLDPKGRRGASSRMAERHDRGDLLAGLDLAQQDDTIATVLMDLARTQTAPSGQRLQEALVSAFARTGARLNSRPRRQDSLAVLMAADFPSILIEVGFLSNEADRAALQTPQGRAPLVAGIIMGLREWAEGEEALAPLMRK